jgi:hypothetical protein
MITPYTVFFALACAASLASIATKSRLLLLKLKSRFAVHEVPRSHKRLSIGGVAISPGLLVPRVLSGSVADLTTIAELKSKSRFAVHEVPRSHKRLTIGGVAISPGVSRYLSDARADLTTIAELKSKFDEDRMHRYKAYCHIAIGLLEDGPMGMPLMTSCVQPSQRCDFPRLGVGSPE